MAVGHESPTALNARPTVTLGQLPGRPTFPTRAGTLMLVAGMLWAIAIVITPIPWMLLTGIVMVPASILAALIEMKPRGKQPLGWLYVLTRHYRRERVLIMTRMMRDHTGKEPGRSRQQGRRRRQ
jgi:hypothetical protein